MGSLGGFDMAVVNCSSCLRDKDKTLIDGRKVCGICPAYRAECEARFVLTMPRRFDRQQYLEGISAKRGPVAGQELKDLVMTIWKAGNGKA